MKREMTKISSIIISLVITMAMLILPSQSLMADPAPGEVDLVLLPANLAVDPGDNFEVTVQAQCGTQTTNGIETHIDFDPDYLAVQSITPGTTLGVPLQNVYDNTLGTIDFSRGELTQPYPSGNFAILTIMFTPKNVLATSDTAVSFYTSGDRTTKVILGEDIITGTLTGATYTINDITPPTVQAISPIDNATDVPVGSAVTVTFNEAMDHSTTEGAFSINPPVTDAFSWNSASTILTITPDADLALDTNYIVGISTAATDTAANHLAADYSSTFTTQATLPAPPDVATLAATDITNSTVILNGDMTSLGTATPVNVSFEYGHTEAYGKTTAAQPMTNTGTFTAAVTGLFPGMEWHYRAVAVGEGTVYGSDMTFITTSVDAPYGTAKFAFISGRDGNEEVYGITPDGQYSARLTGNAFKEAWARFLSDFTKITFTSWRDGNPEIYWMNPDGTGQTRITNNSAFDGMSDFAWDGSKIAFVSDRDGNYEIYVMNADGTGQTRLTDNVASDIMPAFSPDGKIAFASNRDGNYEIYVMNADGTGQTRLTDNVASDNYPSWLLDGTRISFSSLRDGNSEIYTMEANGANPVRLTDNDLADDQPAWCPTGGAIFYTSWDTGNIPQIMFMGMGTNEGVGPFPFTGNPEGNWSRANWIVPVSQTYTITASAGVNGSITPSGVVEVNPGDSQSFAIAANTGYHVADVLVDGVSVGAVESYHFTNVTANHTISATFVDNTAPYTITASAGANGSITPSGVVEVNPGDSQSFAIAANIGYHVADVLVDGVSVGAVESYVFDNVMANHTVVASFAINDSLAQILKSVTQGTDDGYSTSSSGDSSDNATWYEAGSPTDNATNNAWFRFTGITIPANAIIDEAYLEMIQSKWDTGTSLKIYAEAAANPSAPTSVDDHSSRVRTATGVAWTNGYSDAAWHTSPNFASVIRELVSSYSYNSGVIQILVDDDGSAAGAGAAGATFENAGFAPRLYIRYRVEPSVTTNAATNITASTATLNGNLTSLGGASSANVSFEYGISTSYGNTVTGTPSSLTNTGTFTANLAGLTAETTYFYRAKVVGTGTVYGAQATFTTLAIQTSGGGGGFSGGGGGGGGFSSDTVLSLSGMSGSAPVLNAQGEVISSSVLTSTDEQAKILIPAGTKMLDGNGSTLNGITCAKTASPPEPPADNIIVAGYDFGPDGATFNPPITITLHFNIADLPAGTLLSELQLAFWDGTTWQILSNSQVDAATGQISAQVSHFTHYAILSVVPPVTPAPVATVTPTVTPITEPAPTQPTETLTPSEPSPVVPPAEASISETPPQPITGKSPAPSINLWVILGIIAIIIIGILTIASARQIKR